jgi:hypothetical protein
MIGGEARDRVAGFWRALGLTPPPEPDHLTTLLGAYAGLCELGATRARHAFLWEHLLSWMPGYLHAIQKHAPAPFDEWSQLVLQALLHEARELGSAATVPLHLRDVPAMPDPRQCEPTQFVDALLAPARSGLILTRRDLAWAATALDAGLRAGDRRLALRSLLQHDAAGTLAWIEADARAWSMLHAGFTDALGAVGAFWALRADKTASLAGALAGDAVTARLT